MQGNFFKNLQRFTALWNGSFIYFLKNVLGPNTRFLGSMKCTIFSTYKAFSFRDSLKQPVHPPSLLRIHILALLTHLLQVFDCFSHELLTATPQEYSFSSMFNLAYISIYISMYKLISVFQFKGCYCIFVLMVFR